MLHKQSDENDPADWFYLAADRLKAADIRAGLPAAGSRPLDDGAGFTRAADQHLDRLFQTDVPAPAFRIQLVTNGGGTWMESADVSIGPDRSSWCSPVRDRSFP